MTEYLIGIDLGTTNSTVAFTKLESPDPQIEQFTILQRVDAETEKECTTLPSFVYFPLKNETEDQYCVGQYARDRGSEVPNRMVSSAKSWLCHSGIDRRNTMLPRNVEEGEPSMSPLYACAKFLQHLRESWDNKTPDAPFVDQQVFVTVPASFDPSARQLVQEATELAGYPETVLLEEPQAAFYAWLHRQGDSWRKRLQVGDSVLVVDIGGGTTDFSLIGAEEKEGDLVLNRISVGSHLLLGGDNIDLSMAYLAKSKFEEEGHSIDDWQLQSLVHECRKAKEKLFSDKPPKKIDLTVMGRGSKLIGGTIKTTLSKEEVFKLIIDGFMPLTGPEERALQQPRSGLQQVGLPYAQDARITCQLASFLSMKGEHDDGNMDRFQMPSAVLFNGGTMRSQVLRDRLIETLNSWAQTLGKEQILVLPDADYDQAVSRGAVYYGLARNGQAVRIKSGVSRSYYIGVEEAIPAVPGMTVPLKAFCVVPYGMEEGTELNLEDQQFSLVLGEHATFRFFSCSTPTLEDGTEPTIGTVVRNWQSQLSELHSIETNLEKNDDEGKTVNVTLQSRVTELGVLELWCVADANRKWKLEFDIREEKHEALTL